MHNVKFYSLIVLFGVLFTTCSKEKYEATVPTYITINNFTFTTDYANEGSASENIVDAWVYANDDLVGVYELPATFPVLREGDVELKVYAGIKDNGIAASRERYKFYDPFVKQVTLVKGETIELKPEIQYNPTTKFTWLEDFENASLSFLYHNDSDTSIKKQSTVVKEGSYSGHIFLDAGMDFFEATSIAYTDIPKTGTPVYFELDFKTNEYLLVGIYHDGDQYALVNLNVTDDWTKVYINLTDLVTARPNSNEIKIFFGIQASEANPFLNPNPEIYIDNLKLIHY